MNLIPYFRSREACYSFLQTNRKEQLSLSLSRGKGCIVLLAKPQRQSDDPREDKRVLTERCHSLNFPLLHEERIRANRICGALSPRPPLISSPRTPIFDSSSPPTSDNRDKQEEEDCVRGKRQIPFSPVITSASCLF